MCLVVAASPSRFSSRAPARRRAQSRMGPSKASWAATKKTAANPTNSRRPSTVYAIMIAATRFLVLNPMAMHVRSEKDCRVADLRARMFLRRAVPYEEARWPRRCPARWRCDLTPTRRRHSGRRVLRNQLCSLAQRRRNLQAEAIGRPDVDDQVELDGLLHGQLAGASAAQDLAHMPARAPAEIDQIHRERHQAATVGKQPVAVHRGQSEPRGQPHERRALTAEHRVARNEDSIQSLAVNHFEGVPDFTRIAYADFLEREVQPRTFPFDGPPDLRMNRIGQVSEERDALRARGYVAKQFEPLLDQEDAAAESRDIPARLQPVRDDAEVDGISSRHEHDGNRRRRVLRGEGGR